MRVGLGMRAMRNLCTVSNKPPKERIPIVLDEKDLSEKFVRGFGKGGQKVNKTSNCVYLVHVPTGTAVKCHEYRSVIDNQRKARKIMIEKLDLAINGDCSKKALKVAKKRKQSARADRRRKIKTKAREEEKLWSFLTCQSGISGLYVLRYLCEST